MKATFSLLGVDAFLTLAQAFVTANPDPLLWSSDWPHPRLPMHMPGVFWT